MKIGPVVAELFQEDRQMNRQDEANSCFSQFCKCVEKDKAVRKKSKEINEEIGMTESG
jgi:hypothetical protein